MSTAQPSSAQGSRFRLSRRVWWVIAAGFAAGLLMFLLLWLDMRDDGNFYRAQGDTKAADGQVFEPLPTPSASGNHSASGLSEAAEEAARNPRPAPPPVETPRPVETTGQTPIADATPPPRPASALAPGSVPVAISRPAPNYPTDALRKGETGTVVVRIEVGANGEPTEVTLVSRTRSRSLDRAALQAAKRWRFRPAQENGRAVPAAVEVPISFSLEGR